MGFPVQRNRRSSFSLPQFLFFLLALILSEISVSSISALEYYPNGKQPSRSRLRRIEKYLAKINKPAVLSIDSPDGDIIDCVDKWKQSTFSHPLLKNHTLRLPPRKENDKKGEEFDFSKKVPVQVWHLNGTWCPKNTVPIRRITVKDVLMAKIFRDSARKRRHNNMTISPLQDKPNILEDPNTREYATVRAVVTDPLFGMGATLNVWNPMVAGADEFSLAQLWLSHESGNPNEFHSIEAGWQVYPRRLEGHTGTRLFIFWTADNYAHGCYDLMCQDGFVQTDHYIVPGAYMLTPYSTIDGPQYDFDLEISQEIIGEDFWLKFKGADMVTHHVGYFPKRLLPLMTNGANGADWGGEIVNDRTGGQYTRTRMGSGLFAGEGLGRAAYFRKLFVDIAGNNVQPQTQVYASNPNCYNATTPEWGSGEMGLHFFYGGSGGAAPNCQ